MLTFRNSIIATKESLGQGVIMQIDYENLCFYFDGVAQDRIDAGAMSRKSGKILALRDKLFLLPNEQFELAIDTIEKICVDPVSHVNQAKRADEEAETYSQARDLFTRSRGMGDPGLDVNAVSRVA